MKRKLLVGSLMVIGMSFSAMASELDCFPMCAEPAKVVETAAEVTLDTVSVSNPRDAAANAIESKSCDSGLVKNIDDINDKVRPIKELVGYVRSPQSLAIKLVNDHVVKIPAWIGYVMDPLGSIKRQAIGELRTRARAAMIEGNACLAAPAIDPLEVAEALDAKHSI